MIYIKRLEEIEARCVCEIKSMQCIKDERKIKREVRDEIEMTYIVVHQRLENTTTIKKPMDNLENHHHKQLQRRLSYTHLHLVVAQLALKPAFYAA